MQSFRFIALLSVLAAGTATAQLAVPQTQNLEKMLVLPLTVTTAGDSSASIATADAMRDRLTQLARYKVSVIPKSKLCEALTASGFGCDVLLTGQQASQLSRFLGVPSYTTGRITNAGGTLRADVQVVSGSANGFAAGFASQGGSPRALAESIATRLAAIVRAGEFARTCNDQRAKGSYDRALGEAKKAFAIEPNLAAGHLCVATVYEAQRQPADSIIASARRALKGDPSNSDAWNRLASSAMVKGDTMGALDAYDSLLAYNPYDTRLRLGLAQLLQQHRQYGRAQALLAAGLALNPGDQQLKDQRRRICIDGEQWDCVLEILAAEMKADTSRMSDTNELKLGMLAGQSRPDPEAFLFYSRAAVVRYPQSITYWKQFGAAYDAADHADSAVWAYTKALALNPSDVNTSLLIAKTVIDHAVWDTAAAGAKQRATPPDTAGLRRMRDPLAAWLEVARPHLAPGYASPDSAIQLTTAVMGLQGGSKLAQAGAYEAAYPWLDQLLTQLTPRSAGDTIGPRQQLRVQGSFWFGLSSTLSLGNAYKDMAQSKSCDKAKVINDRIQRSKQALFLGGRVSPGTATQMLGFLGQYEAQMPRVKQAFKCTNF